ncbi:MAG: leucine-rich repeat protein [Ruminococcus sp.]|nr:leucine-rich repeat protein [Ruminococcus sp.]
MKLRKVLAAVMAFSIVCGAPTALWIYQTNGYITANAADESKTVSIEKDGYTYKFVVFSDHAVLEQVDVPVDLNEKKNVTLNIPSKADNVPVTVIGNGNKLIQQVHDELVGGDFLGDVTIKVPDTVTTINESAFNNIYSLKSVELPDSVKTIGKEAFDCCYGLENIVLPKSVEVIGKEAFSACSHLKSITILNPDCDIFKMEKTISDGFNGEFKGTICGYSGSTAEAYAKLYDRKFKSLGEASVKPTFGDPTGDGKIDAKDSSFVLVEYAKLSTGGESSLTEAEQNAADINKDGKADAKDASAVLSYYAYVSTGGADTIEVYLGYDGVNDVFFEVVENPYPEFDGLNFNWPEPFGTMDQRRHYEGIQNFSYLTDIECRVFYFDAYMHYFDFYHDAKHTWSDKCLSYTNDYGDEVILYPDKNYLRFKGMDFSIDESGYEPDNERLTVLSNGHDFFKYDWEKLKDICDVIEENAR